MLTKPLTTIAAAIAIAFAVPIAHAADAPAMAVHEPDHGSADDSASTDAGPAEGSGAISPMKRMHELHEKMKAAKTPAERQAAKAEHDKAKKEMMGKMKGMMGKMKDMKGAMPEEGASPERRMQVLEQRMSTLELAMRMQMLEQRMDRLMPMMKDHPGMGEDEGGASMGSAK